MFQAFSQRNAVRSQRAGKNNEEERGGGGGERAFTPNPNPTSRYFSRSRFLAPSPQSECREQATLTSVASYTLCPYFNNVHHISFRS